MEGWLYDWFEINNLGNDLQLDISYEDKNIITVEGSWKRDNKKVNQVQLNMYLKDNDTECVFKPHLTPNEDMVIGDLVFRSPAIVLKKGTKMLALIPDLDYLEENRVVPNYMDFVKRDGHLFYGIGFYKKIKHVYHERTDTPFTVKKGQLLFRFYIMQWEDITRERDFRLVNSFLWNYFAKKRMVIDEDTNKEASLKKLSQYVKYTYEWAFNRWSSIVWQEFSINGKEVGAPVLIVRANQKPGLGNENSWREKKSIWNQAWFSSIRSAYGYRLWGQNWGDKNLIHKAELAKGFALLSPQKNGLFPSVFVADDNLSWENGKWKHSNRRPENHEEFGHLLDMSWTCYWMLKWYRDIEKDNNLLNYVNNYAKRLLKLQNKNGSFPSWVHMETDKVSPYLIDSPETSMHAQFLVNLYGITGDKKYLIASERAINFVIEEIIPTGRWEDFETYWSCSRIWEGKQYGQREKRSGLYNQCSFSIYWTAEALKDIYQNTGNEKYLEKGEQVLAELSLYQAIWNPEYVNVPVLGGFGVMNTDDEWNDARQSLVAVTYDNYYKLTGCEEYKYRSIWAMKASFYMMYCPENKIVKKLYDDTFQFMDKNDYGFEMENAHHGENIDTAGEFTIFDWGNGSASSSLAELFLNNELF